MLVLQQRIYQPSLRFGDLTTGNEVADIWPCLEQGIWRDADPAHFEHNTLLGVLKRAKNKPVLPGLLGLEPGMIWHAEQRTVTDPPYLPQPCAPTWEAFLERAAQFFNRFDGQRIGVQLSGGLDSSLIIGLLQHLGIPFSLVGMSTTRYEFRTERHVQHRLMERAQDAVLIDYEDHLPMSGLHAVPPGQEPDLLMLNHAATAAMAGVCADLGIQVLLTGQGGDNLFAEALPADASQCTWLPQVFGDPWPADMVYAPAGVRLVDFYADPGIMDAVFSLRGGHGEDNAKWWARQFFRQILPRELVEYAYCADFWGLYMDGLQQALPTLPDLFARAHQLTGHTLFSPESTTKLLGQDLLHAKKEMYQAIEARTAMVLWLRIMDEHFRPGTA